MNRIVSKTIVGALVAVSTVASASLAQAQSKEVTLWLNSDKAYNGFAKAGESFTKATGAKLTVEHPEGPTDKFQKAAASGGGPDIMCWAHDRLGEWQAGGLVAEIKPSKKIVAALEKKGWDAFTIGGKIYGYPVAFEAIGLLYNKALVKTPGIVDVSIGRPIATAGRKSDELMREVEDWIESEMRRLDPDAYAPARDA